MWIVLLILFGALIACLVRGGTSKRLIVALSLACIVTAAIKLSLEMRPAPRTTYTLLSEAAGYQLGLAVAEAFPNGGAVVVVQARQGEAAQYIAKVEMQGLRRGLAEKAGGKPDAANTAAAGPFTIIEEGPTPGDSPEATRMELLPATVLLAWLGRHPDAVAAVSFLGVPMDATPAMLDRTPALFALCYGYDDAWIPLLRQGALRGVVVPRVKVAAPDKTARKLPPLVLLNQRYRYVTPADLDIYLREERSK